jgi:hypothetical protein
MSHAEDLIRSCKRDLGRLIDKRRKIRVLLLKFFDSLATSLHSFE